MRGENIVDDRVWIKKTHWPLILPQALPFFSHKVICVVRNPLDIFPSLVNLGHTFSHCAKLPFDHHVENAERWDKYVRMMSKVHSEYFERMMGDCVEKGMNTIYMARFEDFIANPGEELDKVFRFLLDLDTLEGTNIQRRIKQVVGQKDPSQFYKLKPETKIPNSQAHKYTKEQIDCIKKDNAHFLTYFGYTNAPENEENPTAFFNFDEAEENDFSVFNNFRKENVKQMDRALELSKDPEKAKTLTYDNNNKETCLDTKALMENDLFDGTLEYFQKKLRN
jgi:hypothetical protein